VISPTALPDFGWSVAMPLSGLPTAMTSSKANTAADSFQNMFANAAALPEFGSASSAMADASTLGSDWSSNWTQAATNAADTQATETTVSEQASPASEFASNNELNGSGASRGGSGQVSGSVPNPSIDSSSSGADSTKAITESPARTALASTKQASAKVQKKADQLSQPRHIELGVSLAGGPGPAGTASARAVSEGATGHRATAQTATPERSSAIEPDGLSADLTKLAAPMVAGTGSSSGLPGAAFALHVTPFGNHSSSAQTTTSPKTAMPMAASAATPSPTNSTVPDPDNFAGGTSDAAFLLAGGGTPLANNSGARSQPVSALGPNLASAEAAPWSAPMSVAALVNDQAKPAESVTVTAPVAEIDAEDPAGVAQPVRTLQLQLGGAGDQRVDLRLVEHAGGLSVSVRASDSELTRGLQNNLPELSARLAAEHYQTETWVPAASQTSSGGSSSNSSEQQPERGGGQFSEGGSSSSGGEGHQQQGQQQDQPPAWLRQLTALGGGTASVSNRNQSSTPNSATSPLSKQ
jgi:hypothetical protein